MCLFSLGCARWAVGLGAGCGLACRKVRGILGFLVLLALDILATIVFLVVVAVLRASRTTLIGPDGWLRNIFNAVPASEMPLSGGSVVVKLCTAKTPPKSAQKSSWRSVNAGQARITEHLSLQLVVAALQSRLGI